MPAIRLLYQARRSLLSKMGSSIMQRAGSQAGTPIRRKPICAARLALFGLFACLAPMIAPSQAQSPPPLPSTSPPPLPPPLPPVRPPELTQPPALLAPAPPGDAASCLARLNASGVKAEAAPPPPTPLPDCGIAAPVRLSSIALVSGGSLDLVDRPILDCEFAAVFTDYARNLMAPLARSMLGSPIAALATGPGYECRGRNRVAGAKTSAHGKGIAIDLASITLADRRRIAVTQQSEAAETLFLAVMRKAACGWFTTVLGPGSDAAHATHMHFDILRHGATENYRICE
jgi:hypothetical protein